MAFNKQIFELFEDVATIRGLSKNFIGRLFCDIPQSYSKTPDSINFKLEVKGLKYPLDFVSNDIGKIFELKGINTRYKTSTLIFIALLLGWDYDSQIRFINNERLKPLIDEIQNQILNPRIEINFELSSNLYKLKFQKKAESIKIFSDNSLLFEKGLDKSEFELYQDYASTLFKVQFVSKGRDFVTQVHNEILAEINDSIDYLIEQGSNLVSEGLKNKPKEKIYTKTLREYKNYLTVSKSLYNFINNFINSFPDINNLEVLDLKNIGLLKEQLCILAKQKEEIYNQINIQSKELEKIRDLIKYPEFAQYVKKTWQSPISNLKDINSAIGLLNGNDLVEFSVELPFNRKITVQNKVDLQTFFNNLDILQKSAAHYYINNKSYEQYFELEQNLKELKRKNESIKENFKKIQKEINDLSMIEKYDIDDLTKHVTNIKSMAANLNFSKINDIRLLRENVIKLIQQYEDIIKDLERPRDDSEFIQYEILREVIFELRAVKSLLTAKGKGTNDTLITSIQATAEQSPLYPNVIDLFNKQMKERCKYYYKIEEDRVESIELEKYDFLTKTLITKDGQEINALYGLSGGIDSAMTVRSLSSCTSNSKYGTIVLIDEWGDVSEELAAKVYDTLIDIEQLNACIFVNVTKDPVAKVYKIC